MVSRRVQAIWGTTSSLKRDPPSERSGPATTPQRRVSVCGSETTDRHPRPFKRLLRRPGITAAAWLAQGRGLDGPTRNVPLTTGVMGANAEQQAGSVQADRPGHRRMRTDCGLFPQSRHQHRRQHLQRHGHPEACDLGAVIVDAD